MNVLLVVDDPLLRDLVKVGLEQFDGVRVTAGRGAAGVALARCRPYDCVFIGVEASAQRGAELLQQLRAFEQEAALFLLADARVAKELGRERSKFDVHTVVGTPLQAKDLFSSFARFLERRASSRERAARDQQVTPALR
ncbi:MAG: hypothetical protein VYA51_11630 [Planctomycetota bacterium]|nr:hypothetical protein [Planctomycetota bacterium]MEC8651575.1 hypothetical protein [Planctomycetota bacterium]MEC9048654.1 hypothetical protein [Planctomycetota bacterium]